MASSSPTPPPALWAHVGAEGSLEAVVRLLESGECDVNGVGPDGLPLLCAAALHGHTDIATVLVKHGADVNKPALTGEPPLWVAARKGDMGMVNLLLEAGADPVQTTEASADERAEAGAVGRRNSLWFPAEIASSNGHHEVYHALLSRMIEITPWFKA